MEHETEAHRENDVEGPGDGAPVEKRIGRRPHLHVAHGLDVRVGGVHRPFAQRIEEDVRGEGRGENHRAPHEIAVLRLLEIAEADLAILRERHPHRQAEHADAEEAVVEAAVVAEELSDAVQRVFRAVGQENKERAEQRHARKRDEGLDPVDATEGGFTIHGFPVCSDCRWPGGTGPCHRCRNRRRRPL